MSKFRYKLALVLTFVIVGCSSAKVTDFKSWCAYVHDSGEGQRDVLSIDRAAVSEGIVGAWDRIIVENSAEALGISSDVADDTLLQELRRVHTVGAWSSGDTIYFGLTLIAPSEIVPGRSTAEVIAAKYKENMHRALGPDAKEQMDPQMYCLYSGLQLFFAKLVVRTAGGTSAVQSEVYERIRRP